MKKILFFIIPILSMTTLNAADINDNDIETMVETLLSKMTLEEKVPPQLCTIKVLKSGVPRLGVPEVYTSDGPHGVRMEINWNDWGHAGWTNDSCTAFPALDLPCCHMAAGDGDPLRENGRRGGSLPQ